MKLSSYYNKINGANVLVKDQKSIIWIDYQNGQDYGPFNLRELKDVENKVISVINLPELSNSIEITIEV